MKWFDDKQRLLVFLRVIRVYISIGLTGGALLKKRREALINEDMEDIQERERQEVREMQEYLVLL